MKILLLNPHIDAEHKIAVTLRSKGFAVLVAANSDEAWQTCQLHGTSLDLAVIHREWGKQKDGGIKFVERLRTDPVQADLPFILTSEDWSEVECAIHQKSANGANAYLRWPFSDTGLLEVIQKIFPDSLLPSQKPEQTLTNTRGPAVTDLSTVGIAGAEPGLSLDTKGGETNSSLPSLSIQQGVGVPPSPPVPPPAGKSPFGLPFAPPGGAPGAPPLSMGPATIGPPEGTSPQLEFTSSQIMPPPLDASSAAIAQPKVESTTPQLETGAGLVLEDVSSLIARPDPRAEHTKPSEIVLEAPKAPAGPAIDFTAGQGTVALGTGAGTGAKEIVAPGTATQAMPSTQPMGTGPVFNLEAGTNVGGTQPTQALPSADVTGAPVPLLEASSAQISMPDPTQVPSIPEKPASTKGGKLLREEHHEEHHTVALTPQPGAGIDLPPEPTYDLGRDKEVAVQMPYLFGKTAGMGSQGRGQGSPIPALLGDAIIPGAAGQSPDVETLKKYLTLREHDVAVLSAQLRAMQDRINTLEDSMAVESARSAELIAEARLNKQKLEDQERAASVGQKQLLAEIEDGRFQLRVKADQCKILEAREQEGRDEMEKLKERVRSDIRKIRVHERELENRLEILKRDSEALIGSRESKIIELKRKLDLLEFNMDLLQNQFSREKDVSAKLRDRLIKAAQIVRVAGGLLDAEGKATLAKIAETDEEVAAIASGKAS